MYPKNKHMYSRRNNHMILLLVVLLISGCHSEAGKSGKGKQIKDIDGKSYRTIQIGEQVWMAEDLKVTRYNDGSPIPLVENYEDWANLETPAYCWYNNDPASTESYGALYNWYVIESEKLCPAGWHVPSDEEWIVLETALGGAERAGGPMKEEGTAHWKTPNAEASNNSGYAARPGGYRSYNGTFNLMRTSAYWWTNTQKNWYGSTDKVLYRYLRYDNPVLARHIAEKTNGFSVRCVKNP